MRKPIWIVAILLLAGACSPQSPEGETAPETPQNEQSKASRIDGSWDLQAINGEPIDPDTQMKGLPVFEFHVAESRFLSSGGCNDIQGGASIKENEIAFSVLVATRMSCPDMSIEEKIISNLSEKTVSYRFENNRLILEGEDTFELKKTD